MAWMDDFNYDGTFQRGIIVGLIGLLTNRISYSNIINGERHEVKVPFYYSFTGDERFLYDEFLEKEICKDGVIESNYDVVPRGILTYTGINIDSTAMTNPYAMGRIERLQMNENGNHEEVKSVFTNIRSIPVTLSFDCKILTPSNIDMFKISEKLIKLFYKNTSFSVDVDYIRTKALMVMPESVTQEKLFEFGAADKETNDISFSFEVKSFIIDPFGEEFEPLGRMINGIQHNIHTGVKKTGKDILDRPT